MKFVLFLLFLVSSLSAGQSLSAAEPTAKLFSDLKQGPPLLMRSALAPEAYKISQARSLANPELLYFNFKYARELGYSVPAEGMTSAFMKEVLEALAIQIPAEEDSADAFIGKKIDVYADGYGADDTVNLGSGRAASFDEWQSKGIGRTQHVRDPDPWHSNGAAYTAEGLREAFFGEVTNREFKNGANRILAVISTGTFGSTKDHPRIPRALIIRKDPLRPAQYIRNYAAKTADEVSWDKSRVANVLPKLVDVLPQPNGFRGIDPGIRLRSGLNELVDRLAVQLADEYTMRLHHGAYSVSNAMLDGGSIDFGSITGLDGWTRYLTVSIGTPFGDPTEAFEWIVEPFINDLRKNFQPELAAKVPTAKKMRARFIQGFQEHHLPNRILRLTGIPTEFLNPLKKNVSALAFGKFLIALTRAGNETVYVANGQIPPDSGTYDIHAILQKLISGQILDATDISDEVVRKELLERWKKYEIVVRTLAKKSGVESSSLRTYMGLSSAIMTRKLPETYSTTENFEKWWGIAGEFYKTKDRRSIQKTMDEKIERNIRSYQDIDPFDLVVWEHSEPEFGYGLRRVFNAKTGKFSDVITLEQSAQKVNFFGKIIPLDLTRTRLQYRKADGKELQSVTATLRNDHFEYRIPVMENFRPDGIRLVDAESKTVAKPIRAVLEGIWRSANPCVSLLHGK